MLTHKDIISTIEMIDQQHLARRGFCYVGGEYRQQNGKLLRCNQMFVEVYEPVEVTKPYPLIFMHGAGQTNMNWLVTPDGRPGWTDYFLSQGYRVILTEQPARARSAYHPAVNGPTTFHCAKDLALRFASDKRSWPQSKLHTQFPGNADSLDDPVMVQFISAEVEYPWGFCLP